MLIEQGVAALGLTPAYVRLSVIDQGEGMDEVDPRARHRALLHHQGRRQGHRPWPLHGAWSVRRLPAVQPTRSARGSSCGCRRPRHGRSRARRRSSRRRPWVDSLTIPMADDDELVLTNTAAGRPGPPGNRRRLGGDRAGQTGPRRIAEERVTTAITDYAMPQVSGLVLAQETPCAIRSCRWSWPPATPNCRQAKQRRRPRRARQALQPAELAQTLETVLGCPP